MQNIRLPPCNMMSQMIQMRIVYSLKDLDHEVGVDDIPDVWDGAVVDPSLIFTIMTVQSCRFFRKQAIVQPVRVVLLTTMQRR